MDGKPAEQNHHSFRSKKLSMPGQYHQEFKNEETSHAFFPSTVGKQNKMTSPLSQTMNIKNPLTTFNYMSLFRPMSIDGLQSSAYNHFHPINTTTSNQQIDSHSSNYLTAPSASFVEEPAVLKLNIPIEMIVRSMPQQLQASSLSLQQSPISSSEQWNHRCTHPAYGCSTSQMSCQTPTNYSSKPPISLIRKAQEAFFGNNMNNDRGDIPSKAIRRTDMSNFDSRIINETNKSLGINQPQQQQQQQQGKISNKLIQRSPHQSMMSQYSNSSSPSCHKRCECETTVYSPM